MNSCSDTICRQCPRECGADRSRGTGLCGVPADFIVGKAWLHPWEEPILSGTRGSGTIFFAGCQLHCVFCQNHLISHQPQGRVLKADDLAELMFKLEAEGAHNINLVTPAHYARELVPVLRRVKEEGLRIPIAYNTNAYEKVETLRLLEGLIDIYLPDLKYMKEAYGRRYSGVTHYPETAKAAIEEMFRQTGPLIFGERPEGAGEEAFPLLKRGLIVRHLMLPGLFFDTKRVIDYLAGYEDQIYISLMNQYQPMADAYRFPEINQKLSQRLYEKMCDYTADLGLEHVFIQEPADDTVYTPDFDGEGVEKYNVYKKNAAGARDRTACKGDTP